MNISYYKVNNTSKWDKRFFQLCDVVASWSEDTSRKIGSVIVGPDNEIRSIGFNGLPRKVINSLERDERPVKYSFYEHAERNACFNAGRVGIPLKGCRIYCNLFPCADCARAIIQCGIIQLNTYEFYQTDRFSESFEYSLTMMEEADINIRLHVSLAQ